MRVHVFICAFAAACAASAAVAQPAAKPAPAEDAPSNSVRDQPGYVGQPQNPLDRKHLGPESKGESPRETKRWPALPPIRIRAEVFRVDETPLRDVTRHYTGHSQLTPDGSYVVFTATDGVYAAPTGGGETRKLGPRAPFVRTTPDGRYVITPGSAWRRVSLLADDEPLDISPRIMRTASSSSVLSNRHVAFVTAKGGLAIASVADGTARTLSVDRPRESHCHAGVGFPRALSPDGMWFVYQHGCSTYEVVRTNGRDRRALSMLEPRFVKDDVVVGYRKGKRPLLVVERLSTKERWVVPDVSFSHQAQPVGDSLALLQADNEGRLVYVDLVKRNKRVLHDGDNGRVTSFVRVTPDGKRGLYATMTTGSCSVFQVDLKTGLRQLLAQAEYSSQCFLEPLGNEKAAFFTWGRGARGVRAIIASVDLTTGVVTQLGPVLRGAGNLHTAGGTISLGIGMTLYVARP